MNANAANNAHTKEFFFKNVLMDTGNRRRTFLHSLAPENTHTGAHTQQRTCRDTPPACASSSIVL